MSRTFIALQSSPQQAENATMWAQSVPFGRQCRFYKSNFLYMPKCCRNGGFSSTILTVRSASVTKKEALVSHDVSADRRSEIRKRVQIREKANSCTFWSSFEASWRKVGKVVFNVLTELRSARLSSFRDIADTFYLLSECFLRSWIWNQLILWF